MGLSEDIRLLRQTDFLSVLNEEQLRLIAFAADSRTYRDGMTLFYEGDFCDSAILISSGEVSVITTHAGEPRVTDTLNRGSFIDPYCLISASKRGFTAKSNGEVDTLTIGRRDFLRILEEYPDVAEALQQRLAAMIADMSDELGGVASRLDRLD